MQNGVLRQTGALRQKFGMTGEDKPGLVQHGLVQRTGDQGPGSPRQYHIQSHFQGGAGRQSASRRGLSGGKRKIRSTRQGPEDADLMQAARPEHRSRPGRSRSVPSPGLHTNAPEVPRGPTRTMGPGFQYTEKTGPYQHTDQFRPQTVGIAQRDYQRLFHGSSLRPVRIMSKKIRTTA